MADENIIIEQPVIEYDTVDIVETDDMANAITETIEFIEVENVEVFSVDTDEAFPALGQQNEQLNHSYLNGRDLPDQHPITAITGLRAELDSIEALQTVYSDVKQLADYYEWKNGNIFNENRVGYFVTLCSDARTIKICEGEDIFGVTVSDAGFIGGQDKIPRNNKYGLVSYSGVVSVRCESDVEVGDYVISNHNGVAKKSNNEYGCKVLAISNETGVPYATIILNISIDQLDDMATNIAGFDNRLNNAEANAILAINMANQAYNKANQLEETGQEILDKVDQTSNAIGSITDKTNQIESIVTSNSASTEEAKIIASNAIVAAETARNDAINRANEVLEIMTEEAKEIKKDIDDIADDTINAVLDLQNADKELQNRSDELKNNINDAVNDIKDLSNEIEPLSSWPPNSDNPTGIAGFVAKTTEDAATLAGIVKWKGDAGESLAGFVADATENNATIKALASYEGGVAGLMSQVDKNENAITSAVASAGNKMSALEARINKNSASTSLFSRYLLGNFEVVDNWESAEKYQQVVYYALDTKYYWYYNDGWQFTENPYDAGLSGTLAGIQQTADENQAQIDILASFEYGNDQKIYPYINSPAQNEYGNTIGDVVINGITFTDNGDSTITVNGTAISDADFYIVQNYTSFTEGEYSISGCPTGGNTSKYYIQFHKIAVNNTEITYEQTDSPYKFDIVDGDKVSAWIRIVSGTTVNNLTFTPCFKKFFKGISGLRNQVAKNGSSIDLLTSFDSDSGSGVAGIMAKVTEHDSQLVGISTWKNQITKEDGTLILSDAVAEIKQTTSTNASNIGLITSWQKDFYVGGRNYILNSDELSASSLGMEEGSSGEFRYINVGKSYMDIENGTEVVLSFDLEMTVNTDNPTLIVYNTNYRGPKGIGYHPIEFTASAGDIIKQRCSVKTTIVDAESSNKEDNHIEFYTTYGTSNWFKVSKLKLEKGSHATDWTAAPEDDIARVAAINVIASQNESKITSLTTGLTDTNSSMAKIEQTANKNGASIDMIVTNIDKYSVGEYSQSYGLTQEQATNILKEGMIYIPTKHGNNPTHSETYPDTEEVNEFTQGYYYTWYDNDWIESARGAVVFSTIIPSSGEYWYIDSKIAPIGYEPKALYLKKDDNWVKVNILEGNITTNRSVSMIRQTQNEIDIGLSNVRGDITTINQRIDSNEASISLIVASDADGNKSLSGASIIAAVNKDGSSIGISADKINFQGFTRFLTASDVGSGGSTVIDGGRISTGIIQSKNGSSWINLNDGTFQFGKKTVLGFTSPLLGLDEDGDILLYGSIHKTFGVDNLWHIDNCLTFGSKGMYLTNKETYIGDNEIKKVILCVEADDHVDFGDGVAISSGKYATNGLDIENIAPNPGFFDYENVSIVKKHSESSVSGSFFSQLDYDVSLLIAASDDGLSQITGNSGYASFDLGLERQTGDVDLTHGIFYRKSGVRSRPTGSSDIYAVELYHDEYGKSGAGVKVVSQHTARLDYSGNLILSHGGFVQPSAREEKENITVTEISALSKLKNMNFYSYDYKPDITVTYDKLTANTYSMRTLALSDEDESAKEDIYEDEVNNIIENMSVSHIDMGIMVDESPVEILSSDGNGINLYSYIGFIAKSVQELSEQLEERDSIIGALQTEIENLKTLCNQK